jgi:hypothetical protein
LVELPVAPGLRLFVAEDRADGIQLDRLGQHLHPIFDVSAHHPGGELRAQGDLIPAPVFEGVHLLLDDIGGVAHAPVEQLGEFKDRGVNPLEAVGARNFGDARAQVFPIRLFRR